jgi:hypothetical protein
MKSNPNPQPGTSGAYNAPPTNPPDDKIVNPPLPAEYEPESVTTPRTSPYVEDDVEDDYPSSTPPPEPPPIRAAGASIPTPLSVEDFPRLRQEWTDEYADLLGPIPERLPPFREINHTIPLIDPDKAYPSRTPRCPEAFRGKLREKVERYVRSGWWVPARCTQTVPMLCIPKKSGGLRTAMDCRARNDNTIKDVTPFPDQELIRHDVA